MTGHSTAVGIITFKRPESLQRLLFSIEENLVDHAGSPVTKIIIVDNDPAMTARSVVEEFAATTRWPVQYVGEPTPGIAAARNRVVREAIGATYLAIVDDDEAIQSDWPAGLIRIAEQEGSDMVGGPVHPDLSAAPSDEWMTQPDMFGRSGQADGAAVEHVSTANCLVRLDLTERIGPTLFDLRLGLSGGSDWHLSQRIREEGGSLHYSSSAATREFFPADRIALGWLSRRWRRAGSTSIVLLRLSHEGLPATKVMSLVLQRVALKLLVGAAMITTAPVRPPARQRRWQGVRQIMLALGTIEGLLGRVPISYGAEGFETND